MQFRAPLKKLKKAVKLLAARLRSFPQWCKKAAKAAVKFSVTAAPLVELSVLIYHFAIYLHGKVWWL